MLADAKDRFSRMDPMARQKYLRDLLSMCDMQQLSFVHHFVSPRLKKDPFRILPTELCLEVSLRSIASIAQYSNTGVPRYCDAWTIPKP